MGWRESPPSRLQPRPRKLLPWLLLLFWTKVVFSLRHWYALYVRRPLMRLGFASAGDDDRERDSNASGGGDLDDVLLGSPTAFGAESNAEMHADRAADATETAALPGGLVNSGNMCFVNAVVQCLSAVPGFLEGVERALQTLTQLHIATQPDSSQTQKLVVAETLVSLLRGVSPKMADTPIKAENGLPADTDTDLGGELEEEKVLEPSRREINAQRMRRFRAACSKCTFLVSSAASRQEQQDAEEFLSFLLELLHELLRCPTDPHSPKEEEAQQQFAKAEQRCLRKLRGCSPNDPRSYMHAVETLGELRWHYFLRQNTSVITDLFAGQTVRGSQCCRCSHLSCLHQEQRVLSLAIASEGRAQSLTSCLEHFRHPEELKDENRVYCDGFCHEKTSRLTQVLLQRTPAVLVLQLQRFQQTSLLARLEKVDTPVSFPCGRSELLDLTQNSFFRDEEKRALFRLIAVCAHLGSSIDSGHYVAYVRHPEAETQVAWGSNAMGGDDQRWLRIDDDVVEEIDEATLRSETARTAYLLFYAQAGK